MSFEQRIALGRRGEEIVAGYLQARRWGVIHSGDFNGAHGDKTPRLMFTSEGMAIPDLDVCRSGERRWVEVKTYWRPAWFRARHCEVHGVKRRLVTDYARVAHETGCPVWLVVLELADGSLLAQRLDALTPLPCACDGCRTGQRCCYAGQNYYDRASFKLLGQIYGTDVEALRQTWSQP